MSISPGRSLLALFCTVYWAATVHADAPGDEVSLRVKPQLCITGRQGDACEASFSVQWEAPREGHYCLGDDMTVTSLRCWQQESAGRFGQDRVVVKSFRYLLTTPGYELPLAEARVELMSMDSPDRRRSRRNRHAWSIR